MDCRERKKAKVQDLQGEVASLSKRMQALSTAQHRNALLRARNEALMLVRGAPLWATAAMHGSCAHDSNRVDSREAACTLPTQARNVSTQTVTHASTHPACSVGQALGQQAGSLAGQALRLEGSQSANKAELDAAVQPGRAGAPAYTLYYKAAKRCHM